MKTTRNIRRQINAKAMQELGLLRNISNYIGIADIIDDEYPYEIDAVVGDWLDNNCATYGNIWTSHGCSIWNDAMNLKEKAYEIYNSLGIRW